MGIAVYPLVWVMQDLYPQTVLTGSNKRNVGTPTLNLWGFLGSWGGGVDRGGGGDLCSLGVLGGLGFGVLGLEFRV